MLLIYSFVFSLVFMFAIKGVQLSNILYYPILFHYGLRSRSKFYNSTTFLYFFIFFTWVTLSTVIFFIQYEYVVDEDLPRFFSKYIFVVQYISLVLPLSIDVERFESTFYNMTIFFCILFILLFFILTGINGIESQILSKTWADGYVPGFPNSIPLALLFALWISLRNRFSSLGMLLIFASLILTMSRGGLAIAIILYFHYQFKRIHLSLSMVVFLIIPILTLFLIFYGIDLKLDSINDQIYDRLDIFNYVMHYVNERPWIGYGGNTLDQLYSVRVNYQPLLDWPHAHNWILEVLLRYGFVGLLLFLIFLYKVYSKIDNSDYKFMFALFIFFGLFQTFMQNFVYIFMISYFATARTNFSGEVKDSLLPTS